MYNKETLMDLSIPIVGLMAFVGYKLNDTKTPRTVNKLRDGISPNEKPSGTNIYTSTFSKEIEAKERKIADIQFDMSKDPKNTNIIPQFYNTMCKWDCDAAGSPLPLKLDQSLLPRVATVNPNGINTKITTGPMFRNLNVNSNVPSELNNSTTIFEENFTNIDNISKLTGLPVELKHNNMVPFFGSTVKQNTRINNNTSILEHYTGSQDTPTQKREVPKMFENVPENIYGSRPDADLIGQDRFYQSNLKTNLLPLPQIKVQPLPEEYVRPAYKDVDSLRAANKPKVSYKAPVIQGKRYITNRGIQSQVKKNRPDTFYVNNPDRYFVSNTEIKAPRARENFKNSNSAKAQTSEIAPNIGIAFNTGQTEGKVQYVRQSNAQGNGLYTIQDDDTRQTYGNDWVRNLGKDVNAHNYIDRDGYVAYEQERETTNRMTMLAAHDTNKGYRPSNPDQARTTQKEGNLFSYTGNSRMEVDAPQDYTSAYNYTREKQFINNPDYRGVAGQTSKSLYNTSQYENVDIFSHREDVMDRKGYTAGAQKENTPLGANGLNVRQRNDDIQKSKYNGANVNRIGVGTTANLFNIGELTDTSNKGATEADLGERINPAILDAYRNNPYTQNLHSY